MTNEKSLIPGISIRAYKQSEALVACKFTISFSDAYDLSNTKSPRYKKLNELFNVALVEELNKIIKGKNDPSS